MSNHIFDYPLSSVEFSVYAYLCRCRNNKSDTCFPSFSTTAGACNVSNRLHEEKYLKCFDGFALNYRIRALDGIVSPLTVVGHIGPVLRSYLPCVAAVASRSSSASR